MTTSPLTIDNTGITVDSTAITIDATTYTTTSTGASMSQIVLDNTSRGITALCPDGSSQLLVGTVADDGTGDDARVGGNRLKQWAADINAMFAALYSASGFTFSNSVTAALTASQSNMALAAGVNRALLGAAVGGSSVTGFALASVTDGAPLLVRNTSTTDPITIPHLSSASSAANQVSCPAGVAFEIPPQTNCLLSYIVNVWTIIP
jgi:hypothetical protein